jgi:hypothetical protein
MRRVFDDELPACYHCRPNREKEKAHIQDYFAQIRARKECITTSCSSPGRSHFFLCAADAANSKNVIAQGSFLEQI